MKPCHSHPTMRERFSFNRPSVRPVGARGTLVRPASASCCRSANASRLMPFFICIFLARGTAIPSRAGSRESPRMSVIRDNVLDSAHLKVESKPTNAEIKMHAGLAGGAEASGSDFTAAHASQAGRFL